MQRLEKYSKPILRISMSLIFLYFGLKQISNIAEWEGFVPNFIVNIGISAQSIIIANSLLEISLGLFLLLGLHTKVASFILSLHLFIIAFSIGFNPLGIRDFGLAITTFVVFLNGTDKFCLDEKFKSATN